MKKNKHPKNPTPVILLLFFFSGLTGLVYQVVWSRLMTETFGSTAISVGIVLAAFMAGLAMGAWRFGKIADRRRDNLRIYGLLELGIAASALLVHVLLQLINPVQVALFGLFGAWPVVFAVLKFSLAFLLICVPTLLMGATLPVLTRHLVRSREEIGTRLSTLYAVNTAGAVCGVLITGFYLIGAFGIHVPVYLAVLANVLLGCVALLLHRRSDQPEEKPFTEPAGTQRPVLTQSESGPDRSIYRLVLIGLAISGITSFAYEIYWTRSLVFVLGNSTYALSTMLAAFLTGIALGAFGVRRLLRPGLDPCLAFGWIQVALGLFSAFALPLLFTLADPQDLNQYLLARSGDVMPMTLIQFGVAFAVMLIPAILIGTTIPLVTHIGADDWRESGSVTGRVYAINTAGNVLGALLPGLVLLNWLGIQKGILLMASLNLAIGFVLLFRLLSREGHQPPVRWSIPVLAVGCAVLLSSIPLDFQFPSDGERETDQTVFYREGPLATTKVYWNPATTERLMSVDGIVIGGTGYTEFKQLLLAHLPKLLVQDVSTELSVGLGSGILAGESALHPEVERITAVEIEPSVIEGAAYFTRQNHAVMDNDRVAVVNDDIGHFLRMRDQQWQVISADEKTADNYASNGFSYSLDYYRLLNRGLAPDGIVAQWVPTTLPPSQYRMIIRTFTEAFEHVQLWYFLPAWKRGPINTLLIGSHQVITPNPAHIDRQLRNKLREFNSLFQYGLTSAAAVLPHFVADDEQLRQAVAAYPINSFDHPRYEFYKPWEYARDRQQKFLENHRFLLELKRGSADSFLTRLDLDREQRAELALAFEAEELYLQSFGLFLDGAPIQQVFDRYDRALALSPADHSLKARIYAQYSFMAANQRNPSMRAELIRRANALYP